MTSANQTPQAGQAHQVDLTNCDREPIHMLGRVQSFGALISVSSDWIVNHASANIEAFTGLSPEDLIGRPLSECFGTGAVHDIRSRLQRLGSADAVERQFGIQLVEGYGLKDIAVHLSGRSIVIEIENHDGEDKRDHVSEVRPMIDWLGKTDSVESLCNVAARQLKALTRFDRVMVYRFNNDDSGTVIAEAVAANMEPYKGLRYPATDIPKQARALYLRNLLRIISDVNDDGHEILPATNADGEPLDLSMSVTRSVSPIHLEYLRNMGVGASMSISIIRRGKLWGLFSCHHRTPKVLSYELRTAAELFGQMFSLILDQKKGDDQQDEARRARILHDKLMAQIAEQSAIVDNFEAIVSAMEDVIPFDGVVGWLDGKFLSHGSTPTEEEFMPLVGFLNTTAASRVYVRENLSAVFPPAEQYAGRAAGLLVLPVSRAPRDYIVLFRRELAQSVLWAGNPDKPVETGPNGDRLTPRKSFKVWQQTVRNQSAPWTDGEISAAESLRVTLLEVVLRITDAAHKEQARSQERQEILIAELNHRVRNILGLIRSLISQTKHEGRSISEFTDIVGGRIQALARAHDQITAEKWAPASLCELISVEAESYLGEQSSRVIVSGVDALIKPSAFTTFAMVLHELVTNSAKYGSLSDRTGKVTIELTPQPDQGLRIQWREIGGPPISDPPVRRGFGSTIIERSIPFELNGDTEVHYKVTGLEADFYIPSGHIAGFVEIGGAVELDPQMDAPANNLLSGDVLLLEDNMIIALETEDVLGALGASTVHTAVRCAEAFEILNARKISFALLDINLKDETSLPVAEFLVEKGIPFFFASGYGDATAFTKQFPGIRVVQKPYDMTSLANALK